MSAVSDSHESMDFWSEIVGQPAAVDALAQGFADATRWSLIVASVFLLLGVVGAARLRRVAERS